MRFAQDAQNHRKRNQSICRYTKHYGRNSNFSITTSISFLRGTSPLLKTYKFIRTSSPLAAGTPEVKLCCWITRAGDPATVENVARPGFHWKECVSAPPGTRNRSIFAGMKYGWTT